MHLRFTLTEGDYVEAQRKFMEGSRSQRFLLRGMQAFGALLLAVGLLNLVANPGSPLSSLPVLIFGSIWVGLPLLYARLWRRDFHRQPCLRDEIEIAVSNEGLNLKSSSSTSQISWAAFARYLESPSLFLLFEGTRMFRIIPKRAFGTGEADQFRDLVRSKILSR